MKTDDLIAQLSSDLKPVKPLPSPFMMTLIIALAGLILIALGFLVLTAREDLTIQLNDPEFILEMAVTFLLAIFATCLAMFLSRPGQDSTAKNFKLITYALMGVVLFSNIYRALSLTHDRLIAGMDIAVGIDCFGCVLGYAVLLGAFMMALLRKGASSSPSLSGIAVGISSIALGNVLISLFCKSGNGMHILVWHLLLPLLTTFALSSLASRRLLNW